jgi:glycosyltransferase involved in cell wall biosynthesis
MKIVYLSNLYYPDEIGGAEMYVKRIAEHFAIDHDVYVITISCFSFKRLWQPSYEIINNVKIYRFYPINICSIANLRKLHPLIKPLWHFLDLNNIHARWVISRILKRLQPDVVHTHNISGFSPSVFAAINKNNNKIIHTLHDYHFLSPWSILYRNGQIITKFTRLDRLYLSHYRKTTRTIDFITSPSQFVIDIHRQFGFFTNQKSVKIPLGIESTANLITTTSRNDQPKRIIYLGQITKYKGVQILLQALKFIPDKKLEIIIAGTGPDLKELKSMTTDSRVKWAGFIRDLPKVELLSSADLSIVPSVWYDNSPVTIYESLSYGVPVIASNIGGIPELIKDGENGLLFKAGNHAELAEKINIWLLNKEMQDNLRSGALISSKKYTMAEHQHALNKLYQQTSSS